MLVFLCFFNCAVLNNYLKIVQNCTKKHTTLLVIFACLCKNQGLANKQPIQKGMEVTFSHIGYSWSDTNYTPINDAFLRIYGIDLRSNGVLSPGFIEIKEIT